MTLRDELEEVLSDWDGDFGVTFRSDAISAALDGDDPMADLDGALSEIKSEASAVLGSITTAGELLRPAMHAAEQAADEIEEIEGEEQEAFENRRTAARNAAFLAALDGAAVHDEH
ncbi:MAG: hypothetical protein AB7K08_11630 [Microbacteriaceae bacterium]